MRRYSARIDPNQPEVVKALRRLPGVSVWPVHALGKGFPDLCVGYAGRTYLFELKDPAKTPGNRKLTEAETAFLDAWTGHALVALTWQEIAQAIGFPNVPPLAPLADGR